MMVLIGASNVACKCCCNADGGKCIAKTMVVLSSIAFIGSFIDLAVLASMQGLCNGGAVHAECSSCSRPIHILKAPGFNP